MGLCLALLAPAVQHVMRVRLALLPLLLARIHVCLAQQVRSLLHPVKKLAVCASRDHIQSSLSLLVPCVILASIVLPMVPALARHAQTVLTRAPLVLRL